MMALLNWRVWLALALAGALAFSHFTAYRSGKSNVRNEWKAAVAAANTEARSLEQQRQRRADEAGRLAAAREAGLRADAARAGSAVGGLRGAIAARRLAEESRAAAIERADTAEKLLIESAAAHQELARAADGHASDVRTLIDAWPK
ncbi:MAG: hypothetical protein H0X13_15535 [Ramlibacter sp.]|nr:hypothetical protein [Ramlibacter sp.]